MFKVYFHCDLIFFTLLFLVILSRSVGVGLVVCLVSDCFVVLGLLVNFSTDFSLGFGS